MDLQLEEDAPPAAGWPLRDYQLEAVQKIEAAWATHSRVLAVMATGTGKTVLFSKITEAEVRAGGRVLILAHSEELLDQAADKLFRSTGISSEREKAEDFASLEAKVVVASTATLSKEDRLLAFRPGHFSLVIVDETHRILAESYMRIVCYFHYGAESLADDWVMPKPEVPYTPLCRVLGVTATPDRGDKRNLGSIFQVAPVEYGILEAVRDGYLVRPICRTVPIKIDLKGVRMKGHDLDAGEVAERLTPLLREIARQIKIEAPTRKTMIWMPSVDSAKRMSEALSEVGFNASYVSGKCPDRVEKIKAFRAAGPGSVIVNAMLLTEGVDIDDVDCGCMLRATTIRALLVQAMGRGLRPLDGLLAGLETADERRAAIAASRKPNMLILDFLWLTTRLDLVKAVDLIAGRPELKKAMQEEADKKGGTTDLLDLEGIATRDLLKSLEKAARANARKSARTYDPLAWAVDLGDERLAAYEPETAFDAQPASEHDLEFLKAQHFDVSKITCRGQARAVRDRLIARYRARLASPAQLHFLHQLGYHGEKAALLSAPEASALINRLKSNPMARAAARA